MTKRQISVDVDGGRLTVAMEMTGEPDISAVVDAALAALVEREQERRWLEAHPPSASPGRVTTISESHMEHVCTAHGFVPSC